MYPSGSDPTLAATGKDGAASMAVSLEPFDSRAHDTETVARLIYQADPSLMRFVFGDEDRAAATIGALVGMDENEYAGRRILCAVDDGAVVGVIAGLTGAEKRDSAKAAGTEWGRALGARGMVRAVRWGSKLARVATPTEEIADDEYYISALTVDEKHRGEGIGSKLIEAVLAEHDRVVTDVNVEKDASIRFYERHGFQVGAELAFEHRGKKLGNYQIRRG